MQNVKPINTPLVSHFRLSKEDYPKTRKEKDYIFRVPYASTLDSLMYVMISIRPDIAQAVGVLSTFMSKPKRMHWKTIKWVLRYLRGTINIALSFKGEKVQYKVM